MPKSRPGWPQGSQNGAQIHEKSTLETSRINFLRNLVKPRFCMTLQWICMVFHVRGVPWTTINPKECLQKRFLKHVWKSHCPSHDFCLKMEPQGLQNDTLNLWKIDLGPPRDSPGDPKVSQRPPKAPSGTSRTSKMSPKVSSRHSQYFKNDQASEQPASIF